MTEKPPALPQFKPPDSPETTTTLLTPPPEESAETAPQTSQKTIPSTEAPKIDPDNVVQDVKTFPDDLLIARTRTALADLLEFYHSHPILATFLLAQAVCSCVPIGLFVLGAVVSASVAVVVFSCVAGLVLVPVLVGTSFLGICLWGWGWVGFVIGRWVLGGLLRKAGDGERFEF
ncbi:seipin co-factor family protein [Aspergillus alliaceus]|uniref:seipin co-factor family protein n=1 Tax=Petromyces alliaceus TaxID=209559 RepID=UPI0012A3DFF6|nr:uncharacterized protein BDW43DRAFT_268940 [Aspergillus alliaceus]KAB8236030.1 hypothetical protein BDW43DRAFT_268940 [Aspergillus alliaceus]